MTSQTAAVSRVTVSMWVRDLSATFHVTPSRIVLTACAILISAAALGGLLAVLTTAGIELDLPAELRGTILRTAIGSSVITTGVITSILCLTSPPRTSLHTLLELLPVSRLRAQMGITAPLVLIGFVFSAALAATAALVIARTANDWLHATLGIGVLALTILIVLCMTLGAYQVLHHAIRRHVHLPHHYATAIAGTLIIGASVACAIGDVLSLDLATTGVRNPADLLIHRAASAVVAGPSSMASWAILLGWACLAAVTLYFSGALHEQNMVQRAPRIFTWLPEPRNSFGGAVWFAFLVAVRTQQSVMTALVPLPVLAMLWWASGNALLAEAVSAVALVVPGFAAYLGIYAVGRMAQLRWIGSISHASQTWWVLPTILAYALLAAAVAVPVTMLEVVLGLLSWTDVHGVFSRVLLALASATLGGALVPYSEEQPLSTTAAGLTTLVIVLSTSLLLSLAVPQTDNDVIGTLFRVLLALLLFAVVFIVCQRHSTEVERDS
jgi:hypothetical protein